jgi:hypothetical protein
MLNPPDSLLIFNRFKIDPDLPKFKRQAEQSSGQVGPVVISATNAENSTFIVSSNSGITVHNNGTWTADDMEEYVGEAKVLKVRAPRLPWWRRWFSKKPAPPVAKPIKYVFDAVLTNPEELQVYDAKNKAVQGLVEKAQKSGQKSLVKKLNEELEVKKFENALVATGFKRYVSEQQLLSFVQGCTRGLCLDWIEHFCREIPDAVLATKHKADEVGLFDNYVVLHYDPDSRNTTKQDRDAAKDPILFGVIRGSRKLYFIGDWVDELCDLTLQQIVDKLGAQEKTTLE